MRLLYIGPPDFAPVVRSSLPAGYEVDVTLDESVVDRLIPACDVILDAYMKIRFSSDRLGRADHLRLFAAASTGADHVDSSVLTARGIPLFTLRDDPESLREITAAAEHSWLLLMACARHLRGAVSDVLAGQWERTRHPGLMLRGRILGVVGCGRIGQWMSNYAKSFGMVCLGYDPHVQPWPGTIERVDMRAIFERSDVVSIHVSLTNETRGLIGAREFALLRPGAIFVNTSRGDVIDESALLAALLSGRVAAAGLDVLTGEPDISDHPLVEYARSHEHLILTPHIAGFSPDALRSVLIQCCVRIGRHFGA